MEEGKMKLSKQSLLIVISLTLIFGSRCKKSPYYPDYSEEFPVLSGEYLGQEPPGTTPGLFAPGIVSTIRFEHSSPVFSPDGKEVFWTTSFDSNPIGRIMYMRLVDDRWTEPEVASFSGRFSDANPFLSFDGSKVYFMSQRPITANGGTTNSFWVSQKTETGWSEPESLGYPFNSQYSFAGWLSWEGSVTNNGTIYFVIETRASHNIYCSELEDGRYNRMTKLDYPVNTEYDEWSPFIAPDGAYLIFGSRRPGGFGESDLYISFSNEDGTWTEPKNMGGAINKGGNDNWSAVSPDGKYLFFVSDRNGNGDVYWVDAQIIEDVRSVN